MSTQPSGTQQTSGWDKEVGQVSAFLFWTVMAHFIGITLAVGSFAAGLPDPVAPSILIAEMILLIWRPGFVPTWIVTWSDAMTFRRKWVHVWESIAKTNAQPTTFAAGLIPMLNPFPRISGGVAIWTIRPPRGKTLAYVADQVDVLAAQNTLVDSISIDYRKTTASKAKMVVVFDDALKNVEAPAWH